MMKYEKIAVKIGSNVLTKEDGTLDLDSMCNLVEQLASLHKQGIEIVLISSGAVASGRSMLDLNKKMDIVDQRQLFSSIGQVRLINHYWDMFQQHGITIGQVLTMKENFSSRRHYLNQRNCMQVMLDNQVLPIVNENDTVSITELMFTDNDELSGLIASMMDMQALFILSNIDGIYNGHPNDPDTTIIKEIHKKDDIDPYIQKSKSSFGRGGMGTKATIARKIADEGIDVYIANGKQKNILLRLMDKQEEVVCTQFVASTDTVSSVKKWIAHSEDFVKGQIVVDANASKALLGEKSVSLLPIGITSVKGEFDKDDIVTIVDEKGIQIGIGKVQYNSKKARELMGLKNQKPVIHCDYLYIE